jgi:hypothetical protein
MSHLGCNVAMLPMVPFIATGKNAFCRDLLFLQFLHSNAAAEEANIVLTRLAVETRPFQCLRRRQREWPPADATFEKNKSFSAQVYVMSLVLREIVSSKTSKASFFLSTTPRHSHSVQLLERAGVPIEPELDVQLDVHQ